MGAEAEIIAYLTGRYFGLRAFGQIYGYAFVTPRTITPALSCVRVAELLNAFWLAGRTHLVLKAKLTRFFPFDSF